MLGARGHGAANLKSARRRLAAEAGLRLGPTTTTRSAGGASKGHRSLAGDLRGRAAPEAGARGPCGNAPTALFHLLNMLEDPDCPRPAAIIGCPVGFVGAAESKDALMQDLPVPSMIVQGRLGGSAITVAAVNALATWKE